ncbi:MAG: hypothetical protein E6G50_08775 [Actinobacteria bacterium]|nr:MAG: hypothetical protein E6G50_08775 [Actinomycetota bacterium]
MIRAQLEAAGVVEGERRPLLDLDVRGGGGRDVGLEVEAREEVVEVERADGQLHDAPTICLRSTKVKERGRGYD